MSELAKMSLPSEYKHRTLPELIWSQLEHNANRLALVSQGGDSREVRVTYAQLLRRAECLAHGLRREGARQGDKIAIMADNRVGYEASVSLLACIRAGFVAVSVNARFSREEIDHALGLSEARLLIFDGRFSEVVGDIVDRHAGLDNIIAIGEHSSSVAVDWCELLQSPGDEFRGWTKVEEEDISEILFTSGSTARPKAAMLSSGSGVYAATGFAWAIDLKQHDIYQSFFPFFTTAAIRCVLFPGWAVGATVVLDPELDIQAIMAKIEAEQTSIYVGAPAVFLFLLEAYDAARDDLSSLRLVNAGGAALLPETTRQLVEMFPSLEVRQTYGGTEGGPCGTVLTGDQALSKIGSAGRPWPHTKLKIVSDTGLEVPVGESGEIVLRSPGLFSGYYRNDQATAEALKAGWMYSGDIGRIDEDGCVYIVDRKKDLVIRGGHNIGTLEVETVLLRHPAVAEAAVIGVPHKKLGEDLVAVIKLAEGAQVSAEALREFCHGKLADYKTPRYFDFVEEFPRTAMGKILKRELRQQYSEHLPTAR